MLLFNIHSLISWSTVHCLSLRVCTRSHSHRTHSTHTHAFPTHAHTPSSTYPLHSADMARNAAVVPARAACDRGQPGEGGDDARLWTAGAALSARRTPQRLRRRVHAAVSTRRRQRCVIVGGWMGVCVVISISTLATSASCSRLVISALSLSYCLS